MSFNFRAPCIIVLYFLFVSCFHLKAQDTVNVSTVLAKIEDISIHPDTLNAHLYHYEHLVLLEGKLTDALFQQFSKSYQKRISKDSSYRNQLVYDVFQIKWYVQNKQFAKALLIADHAAELAKRIKSSALIGDIENSKYQIYLQAGMPERALIHVRRGFYATISAATTESERSDAYGRYSWSLNNLGRQLRDSTLLDSAIYFRKLTIAFMLNQLKTEEVSPWAFHEAFVTLQLACLRRKNYREAINQGIFGYHLVDSLLRPAPHGEIRLMCRLLFYTAKGYLGLGMEDSAFHYLTLSEKYNPLYNPHESRGYFLYHFGKYQEASKWYSNLIFPTGQLIVDPEYVDLYNVAGNIFFAAKEYEKAAFCYKHAMSYNDSLNAAFSKARDDLMAANTQLQLQDLEKHAQFEKDQMAKIAEKDQLFNRIVIGSILAIVIVLGISLQLINKRLKIIKSQNIEIERQKKIVDASLEVIEQKNTEITDSINYASRIQNAVLPDLDFIQEKLKQSFVLYMPKDVVAGDFYWMKSVNDKTYLAAGDCTGHGVPGAFMSLVAIKELNLASDKVTHPDEILFYANNDMKATLNQNDEGSTHDGMDIAIVRIDGYQIEFSGAHRPLWLISKDATTITEIKGTKSSVAGNTIYNQQYDRHELNVSEGDTVYIFSDGFADQFGGDKQKKLSTKKFKDLLLSIQHMDLKLQQTHLSEFINSWKSGLEQVDDILVIGVRF